MKKLKLFLNEVFNKSISRDNRNNTNKNIEFPSSIYDTIEDTYALIHGLTGPYAGQSIIIPKSGAMIGRDNIACQVIIPNEYKEVSRHHCVVIYNHQANIFILKDLNSNNGTFLNTGNKLISGNPEILYSGQSFYLNNKKIIFEVLTSVK